MLQLALTEEKVADAIDFEAILKKEKEQETKRSKEEKTPTI